LILGSYFNPKDPVNQPATVGLDGQVSPPATPRLNLVCTNETYLAWRIKNLAQERERGMSCLKIFSILLLILSWYSDPFSDPRLNGLLGAPFTTPFAFIVFNFIDTLFMVATNISSTILNDNDAVRHH
jgi:hypothetical protein